LIGAAQRLRERRAAIVTDLVAEMGKTEAEASGEVTKAADFFDYFGGMARSPSGYTLNDSRPNTWSGVRYEPVGIVLAVTPWNDPLLTPARKLAPALFSGNAVVLKPSTDTPLVSLHLAQALLDAGLPPKVLSVVTGRGADISTALLSDSRLAGVTFTGSNSVGSSILAALSGRNLRVQTELGGKNAAVVLADADLELAASTIVAAAFGQAGQRCTATSRVIVHRAIAEVLIQRMREMTEELTVGPGSDASTSMGPLINEKQRQSVMSDVARATSQGATIVTGGGIPSDSRLRHGCFVEPTILSEVNGAMNIWRDEVFGPVLSVAIAEDFDEACRMVNDSSFGLSAAIFTRDLEAASRFIDRADTGQVAVNLPTSGWDVHQPFGGFRESGSPFKEQGTEALHFYARAKTYAIRFAT
jgi:aldehyde dehydrogenase (NAD+)